MQIAGRIDERTKRLTSIIFLSYTFEDEKILGCLANALSHKDARFEVFVDDNLALSFRIGGENDGN